MYLFGMYFAMLAGPITVLPQAADAQILALEDILTLPFRDREYIRYVWINKQGAELFRAGKAVSFTLNWASTNPDIYQPQVIGKLPGPFLVRVDLRAFTFTDEDTKRWIRLWDEFTFDPNFSVLITSDMVKLFQVETSELPIGVKKANFAKKKFLVDCKPYVWPGDGKTYTEKWISVIRVPQRTLDPVVLAKLETETNSIAPVVQYEYMILRMLSSIKDDEIYTTIFGGLWYEFSGVRTAKEAGKKKGTDLDVLFQDLGIIDDADGEVKFQDKFDALGSDKRLIMEHSGVTGKIRAVYVFPTLKRLKGVLIVTQDVKDSSIDILKNAFMNVLDFKPDAMEALWVGSNGGQKSALFNEAGARQDQVPDTVAIDTTIPDGNTKRLDSLSCITCHGARPKSNGWHPLVNDAQGNFRNLITDVSNKKRSVDDTRRLIAAKYRFDPTDTLLDLRRGTIGAVLEMTGPYPGEGDQTSVYEVTAKEILSIRNKYRYDRISAAVALQELGYDIGKNDPKSTLQTLLPPDPDSRNDLFGLVPEDVRNGRLLRGGTIGRYEWSLTQGFVAPRIKQTMLQRAKKAE
jgi:hypothetical protein